ncbi:MAG: aminotransferase DegT [Elusimicrobia bacterium RIFOXYA12_FULL_51_18]|nr:MAG: aminotransferase DegT [Elusimicrobia bacterium RIFOXYA12_FULL_51_18]OGS32317.1 MAG: aminotransferase DegT [Elusimicrobia bacterium RIFOXYA2_FULL_53_38]
MKYPFGTITITPKTKKLVNTILDSGRISGGKYVREFETKFAKLVGTKEAVALSSGTDADALALAVLYDFGARRNDEVIVPALSFVATGNAVLQAGFVPRFVDIDLRTLNIDPSKIEKAITPRTKAIMPVHLMGKPADMDRINRIARKHKLLVVEDAAEAQSARYKGREIGTLGDMAAFSLYIAHIISTGEGGIITTDNSAYAEILRSLRAHGRACKCAACVLNTGKGGCAKRFKYNTDIRFIFERIGFSAKMNELEAAIGLGYLDIYPEIFRKRKRNFLYIRKKFAKFRPALLTIDPGPGEEMAPYAFPVILSKGLKFTRDEFVAYLEAAGIDTRSLFLSMPTQCRGFGYLGYKPGDFPAAEYAADNGFHIGLHQDITEAHIDYFIRLVGKFLELKN